MCHSFWVNIAVIGLGLIGGSAMRALTRAGHCLAGYDADPVTREIAAGTGRMEILDAAAQRKSSTGPGGSPVRRPGRCRVSPSVADAVAQADLVILAVPLPAVCGVLDEVAAAGYQGLVTDVTSVKQPVRALAGARLTARTGARFVGGHPMTGKETSGFAATDPDLFHGCAWVLCLEPGETQMDDWLTLVGLVTQLGARVVPCTAAEHDSAVARISHVPHLVASALAGCAGGDPLALALAAGSFRDGTRVAATRPALVAAMCGGNAPAVRQVLDAVLADLTAARDALDAADPVAQLPAWLTPGHQVRTRWQAGPGGDQRADRKG